MTSLYLAPPLSEPIDYRAVLEGEFSVASPNEQFDHLVTLNIYTCKAIGIYSKELQIGMLAHLAYTRNAERSLEYIADAYPADISRSDIQILQAVDSEDNPHQPSLKAVAQFFQRLGPLSLKLDANQNGGEPLRGAALNLRTGVLHATSHEDIVNSTWHKSEGRRIRS